jgi:diguanylate cyclase (GGDEF)-like protein
MSLLIVDDSLDNRLLLGAFLCAAGYDDVLMADSALAAFAMLRLGEGAPPAEIDLILMDINMPGVDGIEACRRIKADAALQDLPIIMVTAQTEVEHLDAAFAAGAIDYITKPVREIELHARVKSALTLKSEMDRRKAREAQLMEVMSQLEAANRELQRLSSLDGLTGVANRRGFDEFLLGEWRRALREEQPVSLILVDIDFFKQYNDALGHLAGDDCLRQIATALRHSIHRPSDLVARYGGEEFAVVLGNTDGTGARQVALTLQSNIKALALPHPNSFVSPLVTVSLGIATLVPRFGTEPSLLIAAADRALYQAKQQGRNTFHVERQPSMRVSFL